jgi:hypothetical protein
MLTRTVMTRVLLLREMHLEEMLRQMPARATTAPTRMK